MGSRLISSHRFSDAAVRVLPSRLTFVVDASIGGHGGGVDFAAGSAATVLSSSVSIGNTAAAAASSSMPPNTCHDSREGSSDSAWTAFRPKRSKSLMSTLDQLLISKTYHPLPQLSLVPTRLLLIPAPLLPLSIPHPDLP